MRERLLELKRRWKLARRALAGEPLTEQSLPLPVQEITVSTTARATLRMKVPELGAEASGAELVLQDWLKSIRIHQKEHLLTFTAWHPTECRMDNKLPQKMIPGDVWQLRITQYDIEGGR